MSQSHQSKHHCKAVHLRHKTGCRKIWQASDCCILVLRFHHGAKSGETSLAADVYNFLLQSPQRKVPCPSWSPHSLVFKVGTENHRSQKLLCPHLSFTKATLLSQCLCICDIIFGDWFGNLFTHPIFSWIFYNIPSYHVLFDCVAFQCYIIHLF